MLRKSKAKQDMATAQHRYDVIFCALICDCKAVYRDAVQMNSFAGSGGTALLGRAEQQNGEVMSGEDCNGIA